MDIKTTNALRAELYRSIREYLIETLPDVADLDVKAHNTTEALIEMARTDEMSEGETIQRLLGQEISETIIIANDCTARPRFHLRQLIRDYPNLSDIVNSTMRIRSKIDSKYWPEWCFIPQGAWAAVLDEIHGEDYHRQDKGYAVITRLSTVGVWRYSQGVYEFEPEIFEALIDSDIPKTLPTDVLLRLPEWCIYVPTPGLKYYNLTLHGFFASIGLGFEHEYESNTEANPFLYITADTNKGLFGVPLSLSGGSILSALDRLKDVATLKSHNIDDPAIAHLAKELTPLISLLLYICGDEPEINNNRKPGTSPFKAQCRKIKGVYKVFPATNPTVWNIGQEISKTLRKTGHGGGGGTPGHHKRPHLRRAHHHGFWSGSRKKGEQTFHLKWLPPILVAGSNAVEEEDKE